MGSEGASRQEIADEASAWLVRLDAGCADPVAFDAWRDADPRHAAAFAQVAAVWQRTGDLRITGRAPPSADESMAGVAVPVEQALPERHAMPRRQLLQGMAASLAVAMAGGGYMLTARRAYAETGVGERRVVQLPDGCRAELNTDTRIAWRAGDRLHVWLERGEASLVVGRSAQGVEAKADAVKAALGSGRYNLRLHGKGARLIAFSGEAHVESGGAALVLPAGYALDSGEDGLRQTRLSEAELDAAMAWQREEIVFDGMTLAAALDEFNRYLPRPIVLEDPALGAIRLGGRFRTDDPQGFLQSLHDGFGIRQRLADDRILLSGENLR